MYTGSIFYINILNSYRLQTDEFVFVTRLCPLHFCTVQGINSSKQNPAPLFRERLPRFLLQPRHRSGRRGHGGSDFRSFPGGPGQHAPLDGGQWPDLYFSGGRRVTGSVRQFPGDSQSELRCRTGPDPLLHGAYFSRYVMSDRPAVGRRRSALFSLPSRPEPTCRTVR